VTAVALQGRQDANQWVTSFVLAYSRSGRRFTTYRFRGRNAVSKKIQNQDG